MVNVEPLSESIMALPAKKSGLSALPQGVHREEGVISRDQSLAYMGDMLENMRKIARSHGLDVLAHMLELARMEARLAARDQMRSRGTGMVRG